MNKLRWLPWEKLILADQSRPTHVQKNIDDGDSTDDNLRRNFTAKRLTHKQEQKFKDLKLLVPESSIFTSLVDEEYDTSATGDASEDDTNVLPEPITSLFHPC